MKSLKTILFASTMLLLDMAAQAQIVQQDSLRQSRALRWNGTTSVSTRMVNRYMPSVGIVAGSNVANQTSVASTLWSNDEGRSLSAFGWFNYATELAPDANERTHELDVGITYTEPLGPVSGSVGLIHFNYLNAGLGDKDDVLTRVSVSGGTPLEFEVWALKRLNEGFTQKDVMYGGSVAFRKDLIPSHPKAFGSYVRTEAVYADDIFGLQGFTGLNTTFGLHATKGMCTGEVSVAVYDDRGKTMSLGAWQEKDLTLYSAGLRCTFGGPK